MKFTSKKRKVILFGGLFLLAAASIGIFALTAAARAARSYQIEEAYLGSLQETFEADGTVRSLQSAELSWKTIGTIGAVNVAAGDRVAQGDELANLEESSLSPVVILARVELIDARQTLKELQRSHSQRAAALKAVEDAKEALENARNPEPAQAAAAQAAANAEKAYQTARRAYEILATPASQEAIDQAYANLLLTKNRLGQTKDLVERIRRQLDKPKDSLAFWESRGDYRKMLRGLEAQLASQQVAYDEASRRYERLLQPPDALELSATEADMNAARAEWEKAQREVERLAGGLSQGELALLEARLGDARRSYERVKDGPAEDDLLAAEARVTAAEAALASVRITAPFDGVVTLVAGKPGSKAVPGMTAFRIDDLSSLLVEAQVSEIDINKVHLGQVVSLHMDAFSPAFAAAMGEQDASFSGTVVEVSQVGVEQDGLTFYPVTIEVQEGDGWVLPGMTATAVFLVAEYEDALLVPSQAIRYQGGEQVVYTLIRGEPRAVPVRLGASDGRSSQVLEGELQAGDTVVTAFPEDAQ